jgi:hypothetical protein
MANTSAAVPDKIRACSVEMYSATGGADENSTLIPGFCFSKWDGRVSSDQPAWWCKWSAPCAAQRVVLIMP